MSVDNNGGTGWLTFEMAESKVGLGAWFFVPKSRFILLITYWSKLRDIEYVCYRDLSVRPGGLDL